MNFQSMIKIKELLTLSILEIFYSPATSQNSKKAMINYHDEQNLIRMIAPIKLSQAKLRFLAALITTWRRINLLPCQDNTRILATGIPNAVSQKNLKVALMHSTQPRIIQNYNTPPNPTNGRRLF